MIPGRRASISPEATEIEALQADVMRFIAVIGLCLAAIFSLLQEGEVGPATEVSAAPTPVAPSPVEPKPEPVPQPEPQPLKPEPEAPWEPIRAEPGFSLGFVSGEALLNLLRQDRVQLYLVADGGVYRYRDADRSFSPVAAPGQYYRMEPSTVPDSLRSQGRGLAWREWGVVLPASTVRQLDQLMMSSRGGELVIDATGNVSNRSLAPGGLGR